MKTELQINAFKISRFAVNQELISLMRGPSRVAGMGVHDEGTSPSLLKGVATGAQVPLHNSIISNFMIHHLQDRIETNFLWFYSSPGLMNQCRGFLWCRNPMLRFGVFPSVDVACE